MLRPSDDGSAVQNAFLRIFLEDQEAGRARTLAEYRALFPGQERLIEREYALLSGAADTPEPASAEESHAPPPAEDSIFTGAAGKRFGPYLLVRPLGRGGQGLVWLARDTRLERLVALKLLTQLATLSPQSFERFRREAQITSRLNDPGICTVYETGSEGDVPYIAMRYVEGESLSEKIARARKGSLERRAASHLDLPAHDGVQHGLARVAGLIERVARSLHQAHEAGIVHRDLKPGNVMVARDGSPVLLDFGLAGVLDESLPTLTRTGDVFGTPAYMAPEQLSETAGRVDRRADVYSLGATLYECLTLHPPFASVTREALFQAICHETPVDPGHFDADIPRDLKTILDTCLAKDRDRRYQTALDLAEDLGLWRTGQAIRAHPPSQVYRLKKLVQRHRTLTASLATILLTLVAATALTTHGMLRARAAERRAAGEREAVLRLSALQDLAELIAEAERLWPLAPERIPDLEEWTSRARELLATLPDHERTLAELRARARPWPEQERTAQLAHHPRKGELELLRSRIEFLRRQRARAGTRGPLEDPQPEEVGVDQTKLPSDVDGMNALAWPLVDPDRKNWVGEERGLVLARRLMELAAELPPVRSSAYRDTLAWALFANGRFAEALAEEERAVAEGGAERADELGTLLDLMRCEVEALTRGGGGGFDERVVALEKDAARIAGEIEARPQWEFESKQDRWWHDQLVKLVAGENALISPDTGLLNGVSPEHGWGVEKRLEWVLTAREQFESTEAWSRWAEAIASIRDECPMYAGLELAPQFGLEPIGRDPDSGLWEFAHLQSREPPRRTAEGKLVLSDESGLVLVLVPGGSFHLGAQADDPDGRNFDPLPHSRDKRAEPVLPVTLVHFFLSKYEMTQGQWQRATGSNPSKDNPRDYHRTWNARRRPGNLLHPVEDVDWLLCAETLRWLDLVLPTEAQWEYATRAGTETPWWTGEDPHSLDGAANISDRYAGANGADDFDSEAWLDDGNTSHAPVGSFRANAFGLHDVAGNVAEWCRDAYEDYGHKRRPGDGEVLVEHPRYRIVRGGHFLSLALTTRSAARASEAPDSQNVVFGLRPARGVKE